MGGKKKYIKIFGSFMEPFKCQFRRGYLHIEQRESVLDTTKARNHESVQLTSMVTILCASLDGATEVAQAINRSMTTALMMVAAVRLH